MRHSLGFVGAIVGTVLFASYAVGIAPRRRLLRFLRIVSSLVSRPIKLLFLADLHLRGRSSAELGDLARLTRRASSSGAQAVLLGGDIIELDRKSTRLNSSHRCISYAVFCLKKKK